MFLNSYKFNTVVVFLLSIFFVWFFFFCKHDLQLSIVNVFNVDAYDAVGSIGIQVSFFAAVLSMLRLSLSFFTKHSSDSHIVLIIRGNIVALFSIAVAMISNIIALIRFNESWIHTSSGIILAIMVGAMLLLTVMIISWTLRLAHSYKMRVEYRLVSLKNILVISGFVILAFYPMFLHESVIWAICAAYLGMIIHLIILRNLTFLVFPVGEMSYPDLIEVIRDLYQIMKTKLKFINPLSENTEQKLNERKTKAVFDWLNPRKHDWNLIILIAVILGIALAILEAIGEAWISFNTKALLLFSVYFAGELIIIVLFYRLFRNFLGIINKEM